MLLKKRDGAWLMGLGALLCALACAAPLLGLGALGWLAGLEWVGFLGIAVGGLVLVYTLVRHRARGCDPESEVGRGC